MRFKLYREYGALNSKPVFDAFEQGLKSLGHEITTSSDAIPVIWSVLWAGRMSPNRNIYHHCREKGKPIIIIEVGSLLRGKTWRICLNHINGLGIFGNDTDLDFDRPKKLGVNLKSSRTNRRPEILLASQHRSSLQWEGMPSMEKWIEQKINEIKSYTDRKIIVRPHPRSHINLNLRDCIIEKPKMIAGSYDDFDIDYNFHCVVNHNSGPAVQAAIEGTPIICDSSSLASEISGKISEIENISLPDRDQWFLKLCHTEWTVEEISKGIPILRLESKIS